MATRKELNQNLVRHLNGGLAFTPVKEILEKADFKRLGERPNDLPYSFYELFYHMWFTQSDILEYCQKSGYVAPAWPEDYWPLKQEPSSVQEWEELQKKYFEDRNELIEIIGAKNNIFEKVPSDKPHTFFREVMLVIEHNSYHCGQLLIILRLLGLHS